VAGPDWCVRRGVYAPYPPKAVFGPAFTPGWRPPIFSLTRCHARSRASGSSDRQEARERA
jgi:hypothetical protein